jgi:hypothetical protein
MDNMDNSNQQNNDLNNAYASYRREKNKNKSKFGKGLVAGILAGVFATVSVVGITAGIFERKGYLHFGANGEVYVQQTSTDDSDGIGSDVEGKLNAIDSLFILVEQMMKRLKIIFTRLFLIPMAINIQFIILLMNIRQSLNRQAASSME